MSIDPATTAARLQVVHDHIRFKCARPWQGMPPTGKPVAVPFSAVFTFTSDHRVKKEVVYYDRMTLSGQLGVLSS